MRRLKYRAGYTLTLDELFNRIERNEYVMVQWGANKFKPVHPSVLGNMQLRTIIRLVDDRRVAEAIQNE